MVVNTISRIASKTSTKIENHKNTINSDIKYIIDYNIKYNENQYDISKFIYFNNQYILPIYNDTVENIILYINFNKSCILFAKPSEKIPPTNILFTNYDNRQNIDNVINKYCKKMNNTL